MIVKPKDKVSRRASLEMSAVCARKVVEAVAASTTELQAIMNRDPNYPADPREVLAAVIAQRRGQAAVDDAVGELLAWLRVGGLTTASMTEALGVRQSTTARLLGPHLAVADARGPDLRHDDTTGTWTVQRQVQIDAE